METRILEISRQYPTKGCGFIEHTLKLEGKSCSKPTVQKILDRHGIGTRYERLLKLEAEHLQQGVELTLP